MNSFIQKTTTPIANQNGTSTPSSRFKIEKQNSTGKALQTSVTRAFSIKRSSSMSKRYARIHDQYANPLDDVDHLEAQEQEQGKDLYMGISKKKKGRGSILKTYFEEATIHVEKEENIKNESILAECIVPKAPNLLHHPMSITSLLPSPATSTSVDLHTP
ncbi:unnamed protein product [Lactuca saligna]|uniref:Uncharacterized protein n=1 Tax=Lactuca saligna TaxID=75948 RepID=A0AA36A3H0_LACSI|nr:unnamed protein product [Lactuca saligna]